MKKVLLVITFILPELAFGQKIDKLITERDVSRLIQTLSADAMLGRSATDPEGSERAAAFIEREFQSIGLQPQPGTASFRQSFTKERVSLREATVLVDGQPVSPESLLIVSDLDSLQLSGNVPVRVVDKDKNFFRFFGGFLQDTTQKIVLVDSVHAKLFQQAQGYFGRPRLLDGPAKPGATIFVLGRTSASQVEIRFRQDRTSLTLSNVVGTLPGQSKPDERVIFSGHYDHLGTLPAVAGDSIANGADDDASGVTAVISLARYFKKLKANERTLVFVAFTAEEIGGYGSQYFSRQLDPAKVIAMFNIEMIGKESKFGKNNAFITGYEKSDFGKILEKNLTGTAFKFYPDPYPDQNLFYRSDNATLARLGVPAHTISTDQIDIDKFYHTVDDELSTLDVANITATIRAIALSARSIVAGQDTPTRVDTKQLR
jgi:hypothetical protein